METHDSGGYAHTQMPRPHQLLIIKWLGPWRDEYIWKICNRVIFWRFLALKHVNNSLYCLKSTSKVWFQKFSMESPTAVSNFFYWRFLLPGFVPEVTVSRSWRRAKKSPLFRLSQSGSGMVILFAMVYFWIKTIPNPIENPSLTILACTWTRFCSQSMKR